MNSATDRWTGGGADFIEVVCFDKLAATCADYLTRAGKWPWWAARCASTKGAIASDDDEKPADMPNAGSYRRTTG